MLFCFEQENNDAHNGPHSPDNSVISPSEAYVRASIKRVNPRNVSNPDYANGQMDQLAAIFKGLFKLLLLQFDFPTASKGHESYRCLRRAG